ncbi:MAG: beta-propeller fold lactonase family protein [Oligoflexia bacterium]|nr:beta-propeller fold lactonase family protein [Oligoflexia bacterium]
MIKNILFILIIFSGIISTRCSDTGYSPGAPIIFGFVSNSGSSNISVFKLNTTTGALTQVPGSPFFSGTSPSGLVVHPNGKFLYVANSGTNNIAGFLINPLSGEITPIPGSPFSGPICTNNVVPKIDPLGRFLYVQNFGATTICGFTINSSTGVLTSVGAAVVSGIQPFGGAWHPNGNFYYTGDNGANNINIHSINQTTGVASVATNFGAGDVSLIPTFDQTARFMIAPLSATNSYAVFPVNSNTGALSASVSTVAAAGANPSNVVVHPNNRFVYGSDYNGATVSAYTFNSTTGALTAIAGANVTAAGTRTLNIEPTGQFLYAVNETAGNITAFSINQASGSLTALSFSPITTVGTTPQQIVFYRMPQPRN